MQRLESLEAVYTHIHTHIHTHTGYIREINRKEKEKSIKLFSNMLICHTQKKVCKIKMLLNGFFMLPLII